MIEDRVVDPWEVDVAVDRTPSSLDFSEPILPVDPLYQKRLLRQGIRVDEGMFEQNVDHIVVYSDL